MIRRTTIAFSLLLAGLAGQAQDPQFSQFYANPLYLNPALTGSSNMHRITANYRMQWPGISKPYKTFTIGHDSYFHKAKSGVGVQLLQDNAGERNLNMTAFSATYSYRVYLNADWALVGGFKGGLTQRGTDYRRYTFSDQIVQGTQVTSDDIANVSVIYPDVGTGFILTSQRAFVGAAAYHLNQPNESLIGVISTVPVRWLVHAGYTHPLKKKSNHEIVESISIATNFKSQAKFDQLDIGSYYQRHAFFMGLWFRGIPLAKSYEPGIMNNDAAAILFGFEKNNMRIGYSYDGTISRLWDKSAGSHELAISYVYSSRSKHRRPRSVFCPQW